MQAILDFVSKCCLWATISGCVGAGAAVGVYFATKLFPISINVRVPNVRVITETERRAL